MGRNYFEVFFDKLFKKQTQIIKQIKIKKSKLLKVQLVPLTTRCCDDASCFLITMLKWPDEANFKELLSKGGLC